MQAIDVLSKGRIAVVMGVVLTLAKLGMPGCDENGGVGDGDGDIGDAPARLVPADRYDQLQVGMAYRDVVALIGPPARRDAMVLPGVRRCTWGKGATRIEAVFAPDGHLAYKVLGDRFHLDFGTCPVCAGVSRDPNLPDCDGCGRLGVVLEVQEEKGVGPPIGSGSGSSTERVPGTQKKTCSLCGGGGQHQRMCYRCDNGYTNEGTGTRLTCSKCSGSGQVWESCTHCGGSGYTWE